MTLTYREISQRCEATARELTPALPETGTLEAWEEFLGELEDFDLFGGVVEEVESWDWAIYTHYGFKVLEAIDNDTMLEAESRWHELGGLESQDDSFGPYEFAAQVAFWALVLMVEEALGDLLEELKELAENEIENRQ